MHVEFSSLKLGDTVVLPGRAGQPDSYSVIWKHGNRVKLQSMILKDHVKLYTDNQFNREEFEWGGSE